MTGSHRLTGLFSAALDLPAAEREAFARLECGDDEPLFAELMALLAADAGPAAAALEALTPVAAAPFAAGVVVADRYRIVRVLGEGGMGVVYEAEQLRPARTVALKCLRSGLPSEASRQRFRRETELLGRLCHPGIAQILEAGSTDGPASPPFFAMEFVRGVDFLSHCRALPRRQQLQLLAMLCDAVQHAHQDGIVHRDLKPANVLVESSSGQPKVLDFGVARTLDAEATLLTRTHEIVGTLAWLAPEQFGDGTTADPRVDVWSLGVMLYQLLAGRLPFELAGLPLVAAARLLQESEPPPLERLVPGLRGDLATIVRTCLAKEPLRRYADAGALAADLRRHLGDEPIAARPQSTLYRLSRFTRRHRAVVAGLAGTLAALLGGLLLSLYFLAGERTQRSLAEQRGNDLRDITRDLVFEVEDKLSTVAGATTARQLVVATGLRYAERLLQDAGADPTRLREVGVAFYKLAAILGDPSGPNLGDIPGATAALHKATGALQQADQPGAPPQLLDDLRVCALLDAELCRAQGQQPQRLAALARARALAQRMQVATPGADADRAVARANADLGRVQAELGHYQDAIASYQAFLDGGEAPRRAGDALARRNAALILGQLANARTALGQTAAAGEDLAAAVQLAEALHRDQPADARFTGLAAESLRDLAIWHARQSQFEAALPLLQRARELLQAEQVDDRDTAARRRLATIEYCLADALRGCHRLDEARTVLRHYQLAADALLQSSPQNRGRVRDAMLGQQLAIQLAGDLADGDAVTSAYAAAVQLGERLTAGDGTAVLFVEDLAQAHKLAGDAFARLDESAAGDARTAWRGKAVTAYTAAAAALERLHDNGGASPQVQQRAEELRQLLAKVRGS